MSCPICLERIQSTSSNMIILHTCPHSFHASCFLDHVESKLPNEVQCPLCRQPLIKAKSHTVIHMQPFEIADVHNEIHHSYGKFVMGVWLIFMLALAYTATSNQSCTP